MQTEMVLNNVPIESFYSSLNQFNLSANTIDCIKRDLDVSKAKNAIVHIGRQFPNDNLGISFIRKNKYFSTSDTLEYNPILKKIDGYGFHSDFTNLRNTPWFRNAVAKKESETGLKFYDCGGGYDAHWDWEKGTLELRQGCEVIAHFIKDSFNIY